MAAQAGNLIRLAGRMNKVASGGDVMGKLASGAASLGKLLLGVLSDPRVPPRNKLIAGGIAAYLVLPYDFIPDYIPGIGKIDDLAMLAIAVDALINRVPEEVIQEHWDGDPALLDLLRSAAATVTGFVPDKVRDVLLPEDRY